MPYLAPALKSEKSSALAQFRQKNKYDLALKDVQNQKVENLARSKFCPESVDDVLALGCGGLHEFFSAMGPDAPALTGFMLALARGMRGGPPRQSSGPILLVRHHFLDIESGEPASSGLHAFGIDPAGIILVAVQDARSALAAALEGARCAALGAVLVELQGETRACDLTASRRLALAAKGSNTPVFLGRNAARPCHSAAETRWQIAAAPSRPLAANAPGHPAFDLALLYARNRREGLRYRLEWDSCAGIFVPCPAGNAVSTFAPPLRGRAAPPLSRPVVSVSFDRPCPAGDGRAGEDRAHWPRKIG